MAKFCSTCGRQLESASRRDTIRTISVLFVDLVGSSALADKMEAESYRDLIRRYADRMRSVAHSYQGTVEKFIGDALVVVFGLDESREDVALRAVQAAHEMLVELAEVNKELQRRWGVDLTTTTGVHTGDTVTGDDADGIVVLGDTSVVAARLQQHAQPGEILISGSTRLLVRHAVHDEFLGELKLKGLDEAVPVYRLLGIDPVASAVSRHLGRPLVGRERELERLRAAHAEVANFRGCRLVNVVGIAGIGKSRLVRELATFAGEGGRVLIGNCRSYGTSSLAPLIEIANQILERTINHSASSSDADGAARYLRALLDDQRAASLEEIAWSIRKSIEAAALDAPVVAIFEDIHWASPALLQIVAALAREIQQSVLLVTTARPEVFDAHPTWGDLGEVISLAALDRRSAVDICANADRTLSSHPKLLEKIVEVAGGNPLFIEQLVSLYHDTLKDTESPQFDADPLLRGPSSIQLLLTSRLDRLADPQRHLIETAAILGMEFSLSEIDVLSNAPGSVLDENIDLLIRKELIERVPGARQSPRVGDHRLRFCHALIRDAVYRAIPKTRRAQLHEAVGRRLSSAESGASSDQDELIGYHYEQAYLFLAALSVDDDHAVAVRDEAAQFLGRAGRNALLRQDYLSSRALLGRALQVTPEGSPARPKLLLDMGNALQELGDFVESDRCFEQAVAEARHAQDDLVAAEASVQQLHGHLFSKADARVYDRLMEELLSAINLFEQKGHVAGLATSWNELSQLHGYRLREVARKEAAERGLHHAREAGDTETQIWCRSAILAGSANGPFSVSEVIQTATNTLEWARRGDHRQLEAIALGHIGLARAYQGAVQEAKDALVSAELIFNDVASPFHRAARAVMFALADAELGNTEEAKERLTRSCSQLESFGDKSFLSSHSARLAELLCQLGRFEEAQQMARRSERLSDPSDSEAQVLWRRGLARSHIAKDRANDAEPLLVECLDILKPTDALYLLGDTYFALAECLDRLGRRPAALEAAGKAVEVYETKGWMVVLRAARDWIENRR